VQCLAQSSPTPRKASKQNKVFWEFFTLEEEPTEKSARAICNDCGAFIRHTDSSPTGMKTHLEIMHRKLWNKYLEMTKKFNVEKVIALVVIENVLKNVVE
jgi:hypothetical protein